MIKNCLAIIFGTTLLLSVNACRKKGDTGPTGQQGPANKGAISGHVSIYDQYGSELLTGLSNIQVTLKGGRTATTDATGWYFFDTVSTGTYTLTATGAGLAQTMVKNIGFISDTFYQPIKLSARPSFELSSFKAYHNAGSQFDSLVITVPGDTRARNLIVFISKSRNVGGAAGNYLTAITKAIPPVFWGGSAQVVLRIPASDFNSAGIYYGELTYFAACSYVVNDVSVYQDPTTGKEVYNAIGTALIDSAIAP